MGLRMEDGNQREEEGEGGKEGGREHKAFAGFARVHCDVKFPLEGQAWAHARVRKHHTSRTQSIHQQAGSCHVIHSAGLLETASIGDQRVTNGYYWALKWTTRRS